MYSVTEYYDFFQELPLCIKLLNLVRSSHHNKLHIVQSVLPIGEQATNLRETLAYLAVHQLITGRDISADDDAATTTEWSLHSLSELFFTLNLDEIVDPYLTHSEIMLFDLAVGSCVFNDEEKVRNEDRITL